MADYGRCETGLARRAFEIKSQGWGSQFDKDAMGGVSDSVNAGRASPAALLASSPALLELLRLDAAADWSAPLAPAQAQAGYLGAPVPPQNGPQGQSYAQALSLLLS